MNRSRKLFCESLELRQLLAADFHFGHNFMMPEDTDGSGAISPVDALRVINALNARVVQSTEKLDVNADGKVSPVDALTVINLLNTHTGQDTKRVASGVDPAARIARIEAAIASTIPATDFNLDQAKEILATLRAGARPELGECPADGIADDSIETNDDSSDNSDSDNTGSGSTSTSTLDQHLERISQKLLALGVSQETVDQLVTNVKAAVTDGANNLREVIRTELEELGVDLQALLEKHAGQEQIDRLKNKLTDLGVEQTTIDTIVGEMQTALDGGTPLTKDQVKARLTELGVDVTKLFTHPPRHGSLLDQVVDATEVEKRLTARGVAAETIAKIVAEIKTAETAGTPMTRAQLLTRLTELGVIGAKPDTRPVRAIVEQMVRHFRHR